MLHELLLLLERHSEKFFCFALNARLANHTQTASHEHWLNRHRVLALDTGEVEDRWVRARVY
jgi:hypothetical protein